MISARAVTRRATAAAAVMSLMALVAACGSSPGPSASSSRADTSTATSSTVGSSGGAGPSSSGSTGSTGSSTGSSTSSAASAAPSAGGHPICPTSSLSVRMGRGGAAAGSTYTPVVFTNTSHATCTLYGYPGVSFVTGRAGSQIGASAAETPGMTRRLVTLAPGAVASALLRVTDAGNYPPAACGPVTAHYLRIFPPNQKAPLYLAFQSATCSKPIRILSVGVVQPGAGGSS